MSAVTVQDDSVMWGDLQLHGPLPADANYEIETMADGTNFGNPVSIIEQVQSMAIDGALAARTGWDARTIAVRLRLAANDGEDLAKAEQALTAQAILDRPPPLEWTPPLGASAPAVFDVLVADLQRDTSDGWDFSEKFHGYRFFVLTLTCLPFARAVDTVEIPAIPAPVTPGAPPTVTPLDDCTSTTGWTREVSNTTGATGPTVVSGGVQISATINSGSNVVRLVRTGSLTVPSGMWMYFDVDEHETVPSSSVVPSVFPVPGTWRLDTTIGTGTSSYTRSFTPSLIETGVGENGSTRLWFEVAVGVAMSVLKIRKDFDNSWTDDSPSVVTAHLTVYQLGYTDTLGSQLGSTSRQASRFATVYGSMPTRATVRLYDDTPGDLGTDALVFTSTNTEWLPPLRRWRVSGGAIVADDTMVSGANEGMAAVTYRIPARLLAAGTYSLMARLQTVSTVTVNWTAKLVDSAGADTLGSGRIQSGRVTIPDTTGMTPDGYKVFDIADRLQLPPVEVETDDFWVELVLNATGGPAGLDEAWLFGLDDGALTWVSQSADDIALQWLEVRSPDLGAARPSVFGGIGALGSFSQCVDYACTAFGPHRFEPGPLLVFTMTSASLASQCELEYFPRFHSHPAADQTDPDDTPDGP
ncbi:MAG TPA: hypothetical protein VN088_13800 [Nocardioides sp.]|nr:hypothetical protein [Nocardioides sp.]